MGLRVLSFVRVPVQSQNWQNNIVLLLEQLPPIFHRRVPRDSIWSAAELGCVFPLDPVGRRRHICWMDDCSLHRVGIIRPQQSISANFRTCRCGLSAVPDADFYSAVRQEGRDHEGWPPRQVRNNVRRLQTRQRVVHVPVLFHVLGSKTDIHSGFDCGHIVSHASVKHLCFYISNSKFSNNNCLDLRIPSNV